MKPSDSEENTDRLYPLKETMEQPRCKVVLWSERDARPKKPKLDEYTKESCQWLITEASKKFGSERGLRYDIDFKVTFTPELDEGFKFLGGSVVNVLWGILPNKKSFKRDLSVCLDTVKLLLQPKALDLRSRINERCEWCKQLNKRPHTVAHSDIRSVETIRLVRVTHRSGLITDKHAPATGEKSKSWNMLIGEAKEELARVAELIKKSKEGEL